VITTLSTLRNDLGNVSYVLSHDLKEGRLRYVAAIVSVPVERIVLVNVIVIVNVRLESVSFLMVLVTHVSQCDAMCTMIGVVWGYCPLQARHYRLVD